MSAAVLSGDPKVLAVAVIAQAFADMRSAIGCIGTQTGGGYVPVSERYEAVHFLTDVVGAWAEARNLWAEMADVDPEHLRDVALAEINAPPKQRRRVMRRATPNHTDTRGSAPQESVR